MGVLLPWANQAVEEELPQLGEPGVVFHYVRFVPASGTVHSDVLFENTVAASALYNELVMAEMCEALGLASEPCTITPSRPRSWKSPASRTG